MIKPASKSTPSRVTVRVDAAGIRAINSRGAEVWFAATPVADGFNPLELQSAALGICTAITLRNELRPWGEAGVAPEFTLEVSGIKAEEGPSRLQRLELLIALPGRLSTEEQAGIVHRAEQACTIANTLRAQPQIVARTGERADGPDAD